MLKLGTQNIAALCLGGQSIKKAYLGQELVFGSGPAPIATYTITASIDPAGSGTVTGAGKYQAGETVTLVATVADGYAFTGWQENGQTVSTGETYTFTATGDRTLVAVFEEVSASRLPEGYTEVEYIQSTSGGKQYIDTGVNVSNALNAMVNFEPLEQVTSSASRFIVNGNNTAGPTYRYYWSAFWRKTGVAAIMGRTAGSSVSYISVDSDATPRRIVLEMFGATGKAAVDGGDPVDCSLAALSYSGTIKVCLLGSSSTVATAFLYAKLYSCQMENSNGLVRDFVPCINPNGTAGLYDLVNDKFYQSGSSTPFVAGPAV